MSTARAHATPAALPPAWLHPIKHLRARIDRFWLSRLKPSDATLLTQRNVYILPTRPGWMLGITLLVLLIASINYQLNLGYALTFLLAGCALIGIHVCHGTLRGLTLRLQAPDPQFAGKSVTVSVHLQSQRPQPRYGIGVAVQGTDHWSWTDVGPMGNAQVQVAFTPEKRGLHPVPTLTAETRFPLGTFRVWTVWRPAATVLVYPAPEVHAPPLPPGEPKPGGRVRQQPQQSGEFDGVRAYQRGDPLKRVVWKKVAKADELISRDSQQSLQNELWLDLAACTTTGLPKGDSPLEAKLSRLCAWVLAAEKQGLQYGLRLGREEIAPTSGDAHQRACLRLLALH